MLHLGRICVLLSFIAACSVGARGQVLSYSRYVPNPNNALPNVLIAVDHAGEVCAVFRSSTLAGAKFKSDGSVAYSIPLNTITSQFAGVTQVAIDSSGNCYFAGFGIITPTPGAFQSSPKGPSPPWIAKFDGSGNLSFATYLGGSNFDTAQAIAVDSTGNVYVTGNTTSNDFPTLNAFQPVCACKGSTPDAFISVLNPTGTGLIYSTYWGGSNNDSGVAIAVDAAHNAYVTGLTGSTDFPLVAPLQTTPGTAFVIKLGSTGTPIYSTYLGQPFSNSVETLATAIAADPNGSAYVAGDITPSDQPFSNPSTGFVNKYSANGSALVYSNSSLGTNTILTGIVADAAGLAYLSGYSQSIPLVLPIQTGDSGFVSVLNSAGTAFTFSTTLGTMAQSIGIDSVPNIYVAGDAGLPFPLLNTTYVVPDPPTFATPSFLSKISLSAGSALSLPSAIDFTQDGLVAARDSASVQLLVGNTSASGSISISNVAITTGDFSETNDCLTTLAPAANCIIMVTFTPTLAGNRTGTLTVTDTAPGGPQVINLTGVGLVAPGVALNPTSLTFAAQAIGTANSQQVTLSNLSNQPVPVSSVIASGDFSETNDCSFPIPPVTAGGNFCQVSVSFTPTASGTRTGTLSISFGVAGSPLTVPLSGQGVNPSLGLGVAQGHSSTAVVTAGAPASYTLSIGGGGVGGVASLACTGAPKGALCTLPSTVNVDRTTPATFNVSVSTTSRTMARLKAAQSVWLLAIAILGLAVLPCSSSTKKAVRRYLPLAIMSALLLASCGGGGSNNGPQPNPNGTPVGTFNLTVTATVAATTQSTSLTLTVQ